MRISRRYPRKQRKRPIQDSDIAGAYIQALEKHRSTRHLLKQFFKPCDFLNNTSHLRRVSRFVAEKLEQRTRPGQLREFILQVTQDNPNAKALIEALLCSVEPSASALSPVDKDRLCYTEEPPSLTARILHAGRHDVSASTANRGTLLRRSILYNTSLTTSNPSVFNYTHDRVEPPLTPVKQIIRTPSYPPRIERHGPRTSSRGNQTPAGVDIDFEHQILEADFPDTPWSTHDVLASRDCLPTRRLSYPHFHITSFSHSHSPFNMPSLATAFNGCRDLASPLTIRSSNPNATPCTPQIVKDRGSAHLQWSPHCLGCFA